MDKNPGEGRLTPEREEILLRESRRRTVEMRRQLRTEIRKKLAQEKAQRWMERHRNVQYEVEDQMADESRAAGPANRRTRRAYAKKANVFKVPGGFQDFNESYKRRFGYQTSVTRKKNIYNIAQAMKEGDK